MAGGAALVQWRRWHDGHLLGRVQCPAGRRASPACTKSDHHNLLDRRSLSRRCTGWRRAAAGRVWVGVVPVRRDVSSAGSCVGLGTLACDVAGTPEQSAAVPRALVRPPMARRLLEAWFGLRGLRRHPMSGLRGRRLDRRLHQYYSRLLSHLSVPRRASSDLGRMPIRILRYPARRSAFCRKRCDGGIIG